MTIEIIDTHAHLDMPEFDQDRDDLIKRALENGITRMITIGINMESNRRAIELAEKYTCIVAGIGIHPQDSKDMKYRDVASIYEMARHPKVVAIGETGLDFYRNYSPHEDQMQALHWQLEIARMTGLPVIIHCRQAQEVILPVLEKWSGSFEAAQKGPKGVLHCFNVDRETAEKYLKMGFFISLGAYIGYPASAPLRETLKTLPLDRMVIETDCPFLPPPKKRGQRNEPFYTLITLGLLAEIRQLPAEEIARQTTANALRLFPKMSGPGI